MIRATYGRRSRPCPCPSVHTGGDSRPQLTGPQRRSRQLERPGYLVAAALGLTGQDLAVGNLGVQAQPQPNRSAWHF